MTSRPKEIDARAVVREYVKRFGDLPPAGGAAEAGARTFRWNEDLFDHQLKFIHDPAKFKTALCSRRAGKTFASCYYLIEEAAKNPDALCAYIALTRSSAKRLMWLELKRANKKYHIGKRFNNSELIATLRNGSQIVLTGANDEADVDKLRGSAYRLVILDEAASFGPHIDSLVEEVLEPALIDHDGSMAMIGTPNAACTGLFFRATTDPRAGYSNHSWTIMENPHIPHAKEWLDRRMNQKHWDEHHPVYLREWRGQWIRSDDSLIYKFSPEKNFYTALPEHEHDFEYVLGVDLGYEDATAFVIGAFCRDLPHFYVGETYKQSKLLPAEIAQKIHEFRNIYNFTTMVADTGGLGKSIVEEFRQRYQLPIKAAEKKNKAAYIELLNSDLASGLAMVPEDSELLDEWRLLQWDEDRRKEDPRFENHLSDACLYAWRESKHYTFREEPVGPEFGTAAYNEKMMDDYWTKKAQQITGAGEKEWWESGWTLN